MAFILWFYTYGAHLEVANKTKTEEDDVFGSMKRAWADPTVAKSSDEAKQITQATYCLHMSQVLLPLNLSSLLFSTSAIMLTSLTIRSLSYLL